MTDQSSTPAAVGQWKDLRDWLALCEAAGELQTISANVDPDEELAAVTLMGTRGRAHSPAFLFTQLAGDRSRSRILSNMLGASKARFCLALGLDPSLSIRQTIAATREILKKRNLPVEVAFSAAPVSEVSLTGSDIDLTRYPVPKFWPHDGGKYIGTGNVTFIRDPATGVLNVGVYRQMLHGPATVGINFVPGRHGLRNCQAWWAMGKPCEVVVAYGVDPILFMAATQSFPHDVSEIDVAGGMKGQGIELAPARTVNLPIPAQAEFVIEGLIHPGKEMVEGPLGEFHGFYSGEASMRPVIDVTAVHHRTSPIFTAALMANYPSGEIGAYHAIMKSARICDSLQAMGATGVVDAYAHPGSASGYGFVAVSLRQSFPGHASQVLALTAQCAPAAYCTKWIVAVDEDVDPTDLDEVLWAMTTMSNPADDIDILRKTWSFRSDPSLAPDMRPFGSKALIDACRPYKQRNAAPHRAYLRRRTVERVSSRWQELGFSGAPPIFSKLDE